VKWGLYKEFTSNKHRYLVKSGHILSIVAASGMMVMVMNYPLTPHFLEIYDEKQKSPTSGLIKYLTTGVSRGKVPAAPKIPPKILTCSRNTRLSTQIFWNRGKLQSRRFKDQYSKSFMGQSKL